VPPLLRFTVILSLTHVRFSALGEAIATQDRSLVYGGGTNGIMGIISSTVLHHGGSVTAVIPAAMLRGGGEGVPHNSKGYIELKDHEKVKMGWNLNIIIGG
jgi:predicted Rossmann-fold nucleotide-binding protein